MTLQRFIDAQDGGASHDRGGSAYEIALREVTNGAKVGHWIWFVFPQGPFGESSMSQFYAIVSSTESRAYLAHPVLRQRLIEITQVAAERLEEGTSPEVLMGSGIDCQKLASSMTLFNCAALEIDDELVITSTQRVLKQLEAQGWPSCARTLDWLRKAK